jgi:hypothetical protein
MRSILFEYHVGRLEFGHLGSNRDFIVLAVLAEGNRVLISGDLGYESYKNNYDCEKSQNKKRG